MKAIVHIDGDAFFASCEVAQNERLRGKPVVTGQEKGMAIALTYEAKALGVSRGMLMSEIKKLIPNVIIMPGNYDLYKVYSRRMYSIVKRHALLVEEYSVDECFGILSGETWEELTVIAHKIKQDLEQDLGMTFSLGLAHTKTLAKVASKWKKPAGFTAMQQQDIAAFLEKVPIGAVWGIGSSLSAWFQKMKVATALEFAMKPQNWVEEHLAKPSQELWYELNGITMHRVRDGHHEKHQSIRATRTFRPHTNDKNALLSELAKNAEKACLKLRRNNLKAKAVSFYIKTQETFRYFGKEITFTAPIATPSHIMNAIGKEFDAILRKEYTYRATGIVLHSIRDASVYQFDLFGMQEESDVKLELYKTVDSVFEKWGKGSIFLAASLASRNKFSKQNPESKKMKQDALWLRMGIPYWGEAV
ncbi:MAG: DNA polymerase IV [Patescibacteria group bacterium]